MDRSKLSGTCTISMNGTVPLSRTQTSSPTAYQTPSTQAACLNNLQAEKDEAQLRNNINIYMSNSTVT